MKIIRMFLVLLLPCLFSSCKAGVVSIKDFYNEPYKKIIIYDTDADSPDMTVSGINGNYIMLVLYDASRDPSFNNIDESELMSYPFAIGEIKDGLIDLKLTSKLDYWMGEGNYWIMFFLPNGRGEKISNGYISKEPHYVYKNITYFSNKDFMPPVVINLDLTGMVPF